MLGVGSKLVLYAGRSIAAEKGCVVSFTRWVIGVQGL